VRCESLPGSACFPLRIIDPRVIDELSVREAKAGVGPARSPIEISVPRGGARGGSAGPGFRYRTVRPGNAAGVARGR